MRRRDFRDGAVNFSHGDRTRRHANDGAYRQLPAVAADVDIMAAPVDRVDDHRMEFGMLIRPAAAEQQSYDRLWATSGLILTHLSARHKVRSRAHPPPSN